MITEFNLAHQFWSIENLLQKDVKQKLSEFIPGQYFTIGNHFFDMCDGIIGKGGNLVIIHVLLYLRSRINIISDVISEVFPETMIVEIEIIKLETEYLKIMACRDG